MQQRCWVPNGSRAGPYARDTSDFVCSEGANSTGLKQTELKRQFTELWPDVYRVGDDLRRLPVE
jgi:hypothetical protein